MGATSVDAIFGEAIYSYTRKQAIEDGVLVDLTAKYPADTRIYRFPVACTDLVWALAQEADPEFSSIGAIVWDLCWMSAKGGVYERPDASTSHFNVIINGRIHQLKAVCGPNDDGSPCITIMGLDED